MHNHIHPIPTLNDNYIWIVINTRHQSALVVDPGDAAPVLAYLKQNHLTLSAILITHHHWDHVNGVAELVQHHPVPVFGSKQSHYPQLSNRVDDGERLLINPHFPTYQIISIPGHTLDHIAYYADDVLFCGDTLFAAGCGRLFEGRMDQLYASLQKIAALPDQTAIYCAHEYTLNNLRFAQWVEPGNHHIQRRIEHVTQLREQNIPSIPSILSEEKLTNPFLRCDIPEVIQQVEHHIRHSLKDPVDVFSALRKWKDTF